MDPQMLRDLELRLSSLERTTIRYRAGTVTATSPLSVSLGGSATPYANVRSVGPVSIGDQVACAVWGNDLVILGRLGGAGGGAPSLVTALPASPGEGQEIYYQNAAMATLGVVWHLRYRSGGGTYKWEFVGGQSLYSEVETNQNTASTTYVALGTAGPLIALPLAGDYYVEIGSMAVNTAASYAVAFMSYDIGGTGAVDADSAYVQEPNATVATAGASVMRKRLKTGLTAVTLTAKYRSSTGSGTAYFEKRWMAVTPVRVG